MKIVNRIKRINRAINRISREGRVINIEKIKEYWQNEKFRLKSIQGLGFFILAILFFWWLSIPKPEKVWSVNVEAQSAFVSWVTKRPRKGCIITVKIDKPAGLKKVCEKEKVKVHLIELKNLDPEIIYTLIHIDQLRITLTGLTPIVTKSIRGEIPLMPEPAYGSVRNERGDGVANTLVFVFPLTTGDFDIAAVKTNDQGNYAVDLGEMMKVSNKLNLWAISSKGELLKTIVDSKVHTPFPSIIEYN